MNFTFDQLPQAVSNLQESVNEIKQLLLSKSNEPKQQPDELLTVQDAANFLSLSVPTIYGLISKNELPVMKRSKRCYFSKVELLNYLKQGRKKTISETAAAADQFIKGKLR